MLEPEESSGGVLVYRYAADGEFAGDDWYLSIEDAQAATRQEFGGNLGEWQDYAGSDLNGAIAHALAAARTA
ncbi:hypothetical protein [Desertibaculum subflavum]|uniref:hypothetical protein n=1 Tax=Desertibaculum subflavum TaxID=2268458 RepID=UPI0013C43C3B